MAVLGDGGIFDIATDHISCWHTVRHFSADNFGFE